MSIEIRATLRRTLLAAVTAGALAAGIGATAARADGFSDTPQVQIAGYAEEVHPSDRAVVRLKVKVQEADLEKTTAALVEHSARLMSALRDKGFGDKDLATSGPTSDEVWEITRNDKGVETARRKLGVDGSWGVRITLDGIDRPEGRDRLAAFFTAAGLGGATIDQLTFSVAKEAGIQARLDRIAAKNAMDKARDLILATGAKPGRVLKLADTAHRAWGSQADLARSMPKAFLTIPVLPGEQTIAATAEVTVEILTP
jgi:uncharacterized protein YggE